MNESEDEKKPIHIAIPPTLQRVLPRVITGAVSPQNKDAVDWGWQGFIAYGAQATVVVVDPVTLQCAQTLNRHKTHVTKIKWRRTHHYHQLSAPYTLVLASADVSGTIHIWNVAQGDVVATLQDGNRQISELEWLGGQDGSEYLLAALHPPYSVVLWDTRHSTKVWKKSYTETLLSFSFDPFHCNKMAFMCQGCILFVDDFSLTKSPSSNGNRFFISAPNQSPARGSTTPLHAEEKDKSNTLRKRVRGLVAGEVKSKNEDSNQSSEVVQLLYHQTVHDQLLLLYPRELLILDLIINQTVGVILIDRGMSPLTKVMSSWQRDVIYCLHESGSISSYFKLFQPSTAFKEMSSRDENLSEGFSDLIYERKCHSEPLRLSKSNRPVGLCLNPSSEIQMVLILGDGRVVLKELNPHSHKGGGNGALQGSNSHLNLSSDSSSSDFKLNIKDNYFSPECGSDHSHKMPILSLSQIVRPIQEEWRSKEPPSLRLLMTGLMPSLASPPLVIRMCPPLTTRNLFVYVPLMAVGTQGGSVQVINLATGVLEREFSLHTYPVRGIEWTSLTSFLSFGNQPLTNQQGRVRNELIHTDTKTGYSITLRGNKSEESPIDMIKVSYLKQYFIVILKEDPFELWDCRTLSPLRTMPRRFPRVSALEWSPTTHIKTRKDSASSDSIKKQEEENESKDSNTLLSDSMKNSMSSASLCDIGEKSIIKENLVFTDGEGHLYRFAVEGNVIKDGNKSPADSQMNMITCIARKSNDIVLSDSDGTLAILDLKAKTSRHVNTHRGWVKKMRFAPGKDNMKLLILYADGVDIWDIREVVLVSQLKSPKMTVKILDIDWGASDRPVLATVDGCIRIMDIQLKTSCSPINQYFTKDPIVSPYLITSEAALNLRTLLIHQPWKTKFSLTFSEEDGFTSDQINDIKVWLSRLSFDVYSYLETCNSVAHRALVTSYLFGDEGELKFWMVAAHYLTVLSRQTPLEGEKEPPSEEGGEKEAVPALVVPYLDTSFYHLCDNTVYKTQELERLIVHEGKEVSGPLREDLGRRLAVVGERDRVVRLLLDGDPSHASFYPDCLRACLLAATHHSTQATSTIKLVATNLIAAGNIWEGIELLCIIGKAIDACRYLQSHGLWDDSVWLAKCVLPPSEANDIIKRWANSLINSGKKDLGIRTLISIGDLSSALDHLSRQHHHQRAALLLEASKELGVLAENNAVSKELDVDSSHSPLSSVLPSIPQNIYRKYVLYLFGFSNRPAMNHFCAHLGELGKELLQELEIP